MLFLGSSEIWNDKVSLLHINVTQRGGEHGGKSFGNKCFNKSCKSLFCNEVEQSINKTRIYSLLKSKGKLRYTIKVVGKYIKKDAT